MNTLGDLSGCPIEVSSFPNCAQFPSLAHGNWRAQAAATSYFRAIQAAAKKDKSGYNTNLSKGDGYKAQLSGPIISWLGEARNKAITVSRLHLSRSDAAATRYAPGVAVRSSGPVLSSEAPPEIDIWGNAFRQSAKDIGAGDPFRGAREGGYTPQGVGRNVQYALTGKNPQDKSKPGDWGAPDPDDPDACPFFDFGCQWDKNKWKILLSFAGVLFAVIAVYGLSSGVGRGLVS